MKIKPLYDRVVLSPLKTKEKTLGGLVLPEVAQEKSQIAKVIAVGKGGNLDGKELEIQVCVGDKVLYSKYAGTDIKVEGEDYVVVRQTDVLAVIEEEKWKK